MPPSNCSMAAPWWLPYRPTRFQGYISNSDNSVVPSVGGPNGSNTSYAAGSTMAYLLRQLFRLRSAELHVSSDSPTITSAELVVKSGEITNNLTYTLFGASQWVSQIETPAVRDSTLYQNLLSGLNNLYGSFKLGQNTGNPVAPLIFAPQAGSSVDRHQHGDRQWAAFVVAGHVDPAVAPEPSTWVMMLAGFVDLASLRAGVRPSAGLRPRPDKASSGDRLTPPASGAAGDRRRQFPRRRTIFFAAFDARPRERPSVKSWLTSPSRPRSARA